MVEGKGPSLPAAAEHQAGQVLILPHDDGQVLLRQFRRVSRGADHRLHAELGEAQIQHDLDVL